MRIDLSKISNDIASKILKEDFKISDEDSKQAEMSKQLDSDDLRAPAKSKKEELTDEGEEEEEDKEEEEEEKKDIEAKSKPDSGEDESDENFEVQAPEAIPDLVSYKQIEKQINNLRAGKSLKDEDISGALEDYFDNLGPGETDALFTYLASIGAILTGGMTGDAAPRPSEMGIKITSKTKEEKPKTPAGEPDAVGIDLPPGEAPIIVGEMADKYDELSMVLENYSSSDSHRCLGGKIVDFGSSGCIDDLNSRIDDTTQQRDSLNRGTADRSSLNGTLKYLRQKLRKAKKISKQDEELRVQSKLNFADSA